MGGQALEWAAQGGGGVADPGGVQATFGRCVEGHGLERTIGDRWMVGLNDLVDFFPTLMILQFDDVALCFLSWYHFT